MGKEVVMGRGIILEMDSGDGCRMLGIYLMPLNCTLKTENFMLHISSHNESILYLNYRMLWHPLRDELPSLHYGSQTGTSTLFTLFREPYAHGLDPVGYGGGMQGVRGTWQGSYYLGPQEEDGETFLVGRPAYGQHGRVMECGSLEEGSGTVMLEELV